MRTKEQIENIKNRINRFPFIISFISIVILIFDLGYNQNAQIQHIINKIYLITLFFGLVSPLLKDFFFRHNIGYKVWAFDIFSIFYVLTILLLNLNLLEHTPSFHFLKNHLFTYLAIFLVFIREFSSQKINLKKSIFNPAQLFIISFFMIILIGTLLLMLPNSTHYGIRAIDAIFTSTSAVCVTGLAVVDTGTYFTEFGITIIIILIQVGGLGIMTFASYFSYFFTGGSTYKNHIVLSDITNVDKLGEVFSTLKKIILLTFVIETIGAILIFYSLDDIIIPSLYDRISFSFFHSISGFCNAGFSTLPFGFYEVGFKFNYYLQLVVACLIIFGGLGFPIVFNISKYIKHIFIKRIFSFKNELRGVHIPWVLNLSSRIILITTFFLIVSGTMFFYVLEYNNTLTEHGFFGKIVTSFFSSVTTRTAGFNTVDIGTLRISTLIIFILLMWIGASPGSTGGGIKTSTFAIALLNIVSIAKGKTRIELFRREISDISVRRSYAIIILSLITIGIAILLISAIESDKNLLSISFECFSAYSTVGLN